MTKNKSVESRIEAYRKLKIETTYKYIPILGEILGFWREVEVGYVGERVELHINTPLREYDRLFINGQLIDHKNALLITNPKK